MDDFVVLPKAAVKFVVEVKSNLDLAKLTHVRDVWVSTLPMSIPTFAFAYEGMRPDTLIRQPRHVATIRGIVDAGPTRLFGRTRDRHRRRRAQVLPERLGR